MPSGVSQGWNVNECFDKAVNFKIKKRPPLKISVETSCISWPLEVEEIMLPVACEKSAGGFKYEKFPIVHPHRVVSYLIDEVGVVISEADCVEFWRHAIEFKQPWALGFEPNDPDRMKRVPLGLYGDGAQLITRYKVEKQVAIFFNFVLYRPRSIRSSRYLLFTMDEAKLFSNRTLNAVYRRLVWSFEALFHGRNPSSGPHGKPLGPKDAQRAGQPIVRSGRKFCVTEFRGDWKWHRDTFHFVASWQGNQICYQCPARSVNDMGPGYLYWNPH